MCHRQSGKGERVKFFINDKNIASISHTVSSSASPFSGCFRYVIYEFLWCSMSHAESWCGVKVHSHRMSSATLFFLFFFFFVTFNKKNQLSFSFSLLFFFVPPRLLMFDNWELKFGILFFRLFLSWFDEAKSGSSSSARTSKHFILLLRFRIPLDNSIPSIATSTIMSETR